MLKLTPKAQTHRPCNFDCTYTPNLKIIIMVHSKNCHITITGVWEENCLRFTHISLLALLINPPSWESTSLAQMWISSSQGPSQPSLVQFASTVLQQQIKMWKFNGWQVDNGCKVMAKVHMSFCQIS
jgi:hypothetical protein